MVGASGGCVCCPPGILRWPYRMLKLVREKVTNRAAALDALLAATTATATATATTTTTSSSTASRGRTRVSAATTATAAAPATTARPTTPAPPPQRLQLEQFGQLVDQFVIFGFSIGVTKPDPIV